MFNNTYYKNEWKCNAKKYVCGGHIAVRGRALPRVADIFSARRLLGTGGRTRCASDLFEIRSRLGTLSISR